MAMQLPAWQAANRAQDKISWTKLLLVYLQVVILMLEYPRLPAIEGEHHGLPLHILRPHFHLLWPLQNSNNS